jgi:hypothetical protein
MKEENERIHSESLTLFVPELWSDLCT